ncbi:hypothetical protein IIC68_02415 [archaeon]|nr:hypothetical protein [archaeon]
MGIQSAKIEGGEIIVNVIRNSGKGNVTGIKFIFFDGKNSEIVERKVSLKELEQMVFNFTLNKLNISEVETISIAPIFASGSGKEFIGEINLFNKIKLNTGNITIELDDEIQFLVMPLINFTEAPGITFSEKLSWSVDNIIELINETGNGETQQLAFSLIVQTWTIPDIVLIAAINDVFAVAKDKNVAIHLIFESHYFWETREELWNYYDPGLPDYDPTNYLNVEWSDWNATPFPIRYLNWGTPQRLAPHMCYNSNDVRSEIERLVTQVIGPAIKTEIDILESEGKSHLFSGITVGSEPKLDDYAALNPNDPIRLLMALDNVSAVTLGYCALTNKGFSEVNLPADFRTELANINQEFISFWAENFVSSGISSSKLYTHVAPHPEELNDFWNAPLWVAFNDFSRPGFSSYPFDRLSENFSVLYDELEVHGNPPWGGTESNPSGFGFTSVPPEKYLAWHFNHGATVVVINYGATSEQLENILKDAALGPDAIAAYQKFLRGEILIE